MNECECGNDYELPCIYGIIYGFPCIYGIIYGYCEHPNCSGGCEPLGDCDCSCHSEAEKVSDKDE